MRWAANPDKIYRNIAYGLAHLETSLHLRIGEYPRQMYMHSFHYTRCFEYPWVITNLPEKRGRLLDAGGGETPLQFFFASDKDTEVYNVDCDKAAVENMKRHLRVLREQGLYNNIHAVYGDLSSLDFPDKFFDNTYSVSVLEHTKHSEIPDKIREMMRVTRNRVLITVDVTIKLGVNPAVFTKKMLYKLADIFGFDVPRYPDNLRMQVLKEPDDAPHEEQVFHSIAVACIYLNSE